MAQLHPSVVEKLLTYLETMDDNLFYRKDGQLMTRFDSIRFRTPVKYSTDMVLEFYWKGQPIWEICLGRVSPGDTININGFDASTEVQGVPA